MSLILTVTGLAAYAQADASGTKLQATHMAVGDGGGQAVSHTQNSTELVNEVWRGELQEITVAASGEVEFVAHVPLTVGGWYIREAALYADDTLLAIGSHPEIWKPAPESPDKLELEITAPVKFDNAATLSLTVDTTKVLASQEFVVNEIAEHDADLEAHAAILGALGDGLEEHVNRADNPHGVTAAQVGAAPAVHVHVAAEITDLLTAPRSYAAIQAYTPVILEPDESGAVEWDLTAGAVAELTLDRDVTVTMVNAVPGSSPLLRTKQDATGGWAVVWPSGIRWAGGAAHEVATDAGAEDAVQVDVAAEGTIYAQGSAGYAEAS